MSGLINVRGARSGVIGTVTGTTAAAAAGITHSSQWVINAATSGTDITPYTAWAELEAMGASLIVAAGIFTFPVTGYWLISLKTFGIMSGTGYVNTIIMKDEGSGFVNAALETDAHTVSAAGTQRAHSAGPYLFDVTDVATCKVRFDQGVFQDTGSGGYALSHNATTYNSGATFVRLGDT